MNIWFSKYVFHSILQINQIICFKISYVSWSMELSHYNVGTTFIFHNFVQVIPSTINVTNFAIPSFTWINMYGMIYWTLTKYVKNKLICFMVNEIIMMRWRYCNYTSRLSSSDLIPSMWPILQHPHLNILTILHWSINKQFLSFMSLKMYFNYI